MFAMNRRQFLTTSAAGAGLLWPGVDLQAAPKSPSDRINLAFIGVGTMGRGHLGSFVGMNGVQVVAVCDVVRERRESAKKIVEDHYGKNKKSEYKGCATETDFRKILERKDIDAVVIATPDHWHAIPSILAARAGKHIYCEKPLTHNIAEGRRLVEEVKKANVIFQVGSQQRSEFADRFRLAVELVRNGRLGKLSRINVGVGGPAVPCELKEEAIPDGTDWGLWQGPAPTRAYNSVLCPKGVHSHFPQWRAYREYAGGLLADMGAHHFDIAQWAMDMDGSGPVKIVPPEKGDSGLKFVYANGVEMYHGGNVDCEFIGDKGTLRVWRSKMESTPGEMMTTPIGEKEFHVYPSSNHRVNWLECIRSGKTPICPPEVGHRSASICHLGNIGYRVRKTLTWDPVKEQFTDPEANKLLSREPRAEWKI